MGPAARGVALALLLLSSAAAEASEGRNTMLGNSWRGLTPGASSAQDVVAILGRAERDASDVTYGSTAGLTMLTYYDLGVSVFLRDNRVLLMVIAPKPGDVFPRDADTLRAALGEANTKLPSVGGKNHRVWVYGQQGIAATVDGHRVELVELFPPTTADRYISTLYKRPPAFTK